MPQCPLCGNQSNIHSFTYRDKTIYYPCTFCNAKLNALVNPKDFSEKENALRWADNLLEKTYNPPATDTLKTLCSLSKKSDIKPSGQNETSAPPIVQYESNIETSRLSDRAYLPSSTYSAAVKAIVIIFICITVLSGVISGALLGGFGGFMLGLIASGISAGVVYVIAMMLVETAENTAIGARTALRNEKLLEEIRDSLKNSQK